ncbi:MAG: CoA-binding protein [Spirochaetales bacterium]|nr:CoA-binding protein [Spirochaetales bacterium]
MEDLIREFLAQKSFAVAGSFRDNTKYAYKILKDLIAAGYEVYPLHPTLQEVEGLPCYKSVTDIPKTVDVVDLVTPPHATLEIVQQCTQKGITRIWMQPGAESREAIDFCHRHNMKAIYGTCLMLNLASKP